MVCTKISTSYPTEQIVQYRNDILLFILMKNILSNHEGLYIMPPCCKCFQMHFPGKWKILCMLIQIILKVLSLGPIGNNSEFVQLMAWHGRDDKHCPNRYGPRWLTPYIITRPQWVNEIFRHMVLVSILKQIWWTLIISSFSLDWFFSYQRQFLVKEAPTRAMYQYGTAQGSLTAILNFMLID